MPGNVDVKPREAYAFHLLNQASDLTGDEDLMEEVRVYFEAVKCRRLRRALEGFISIAIYPDVPGTCGFLPLHSVQEFLGGNMSQHMAYTI